MSNLIPAALDAAGFGGCGDRGADGLAEPIMIPAPISPLAFEAVKRIDAAFDIERARVSGKSDIGKAMDYMLKRWDGFTRFRHDGRICLTNNAAERALRGVALGRR